MDRYIYIETENGSHGTKVCGFVRQNRIPRYKSVKPARCYWHLNHGSQLA